jgi:hypothetical protein
MAGAKEGVLIILRHDLEATTIKMFLPYLAKH